MLDIINNIITIIMIIVIICLIFCFIGKNFLKKENTIEKFNSNNNTKTITINLLVKGELYIVLAKSPLRVTRKGNISVYNSIDKSNRKLSITSNRLIDSNGTNKKTILIKNYSKGDQILFYHRNSYGKKNNLNGWWAAKFNWISDGINYSDISSRQNVKCLGTTLSNSDNINKLDIHIAGKKLGCYVDGPSRRLPNLLHNQHSSDAILNNECKSKAIKHSNKYYGLQYGGECWGGNDYGRAVSYGKRNNCTMRSKKKNVNYYGNTTKQTQGNGWRNEIYTINESPRVRTCGIVTKLGMDDSRNRPNKITAEEGHDCSHSIFNEWVVFSWKLPDYFFNETNYNKIIDFCPDIKYNNFILGCNNPTTRNYCENSVKSGYKANFNLCIDKFENIIDDTIYDKIYIYFDKVFINYSENSPYWKNIIKKKNIAKFNTILNNFKIQIIDYIQNKPLTDTYNYENKESEKNQVNNITKNNCNDILDYLVGYINYLISLKNNKDERIISREDQFKNLVTDIREFYFLNKTY